MGLSPDEQQLIVNNMELNEETPLKKIKLPTYPIEVKKLTNLVINIGKVSFPLRFYLGYKCSVLYKHIVNVGLVT